MGHLVPLLPPFPLRNFGHKCFRSLSLPVESMSMKHFHIAENRVKKPLSQLDVHKPMGPNEKGLRDSIGQYHYLSSLKGSKEGSCKLIKAEYHTNTQEKQEGRFRELIASQLRLSLWENNRAISSGSNFQAQKQ